MRLGKRRPAVTRRQAQNFDVQILHPAGRFVNPVPEGLRAALVDMGEALDGLRALSRERKGLCDVR